MGLFSETASVCNFSLSPFRIMDALHLGKCVTLGVQQSI